MDYIHTITRLIVTVIDLQKVFESTETEVMEALGSQEVSTHDINVEVKRGVRQGDTISPKLFTATLQNVMRTLEWDNMRVKIDGRQLHHLRFADDIVLITLNISQAQLMLADFDKACERLVFDQMSEKRCSGGTDWLPMPYSRPTEPISPNSPIMSI
uniref:Reverse transcriptase domain-containing protein n=1 Tax=Angiostrongylus cantonensis TaxID=6313 RepID=A0A0K0DHS8_ANGCA